MITGFVLDKGVEEEMYSGGCSDAEQHTEGSELLSVEE